GRQDCITRSVRRRHCSRTGGNMLGSSDTFRIRSLAVPFLSSLASLRPVPPGAVSIDPRQRSTRPELSLRPRTGRTHGARFVRVLNWNLLHARKDNDARLDIVARVLEDEQPDVVALQEVSQSWLLRRPNRAEVLAKRLGFAWKYRATNG